MKLKKIAMGLGCLAVSTMTMAGSYSVFPGYVAHGINTYNGSPIGDYSVVAPGVGMLNSETAILEIGALAAEGSFDSQQITPYTDRNTPLATTRSFFDFFVPGGEIDETTVNVTLDEIGTNYFGFTAPEDRVVAGNFEDSASEPSIYRAKGVNESPTVGEWEDIQGKMTVVERRNGKSIVRITIREALPNSIYTLWDVGIKNPSTETAAGYAVPLGGLPNAMITDNNGCAYKEIEMAYSPARSCEAGEASCSAYISAFYHWDAQVYGGAPAGTWSKLPTGIYAGNQMVFPTSGELLQEPVTELSKPSIHGCYPKFSRKK
ncbi:hypothetical protein [Litoribacillus peritrichatus]|uniref:Uncharacterized protein n=1 Tax=Litoribacillus peritrichatus TaxID=718191 RepID=A0ABP7MBW4_9GAMM